MCRLVLCECKQHSRSGTEHGVRQLEGASEPGCVVCRLELGRSVLSHSAEEEDRRSAGREQMWRFCCLLQIYVCTDLDPDLLLFHGLFCCNFLFSILFGCLPCAASSIRRILFMPGDWKGLSTTVSSSSLLCSLKHCFVVEGSTGF